MITLKCAACGFVSDVDTRDKLTTFVLKNPPEQKKGAKDRKGLRRAEKERLKEGEAADEEKKKKLKKDTKKKTRRRSLRRQRNRALPMVPLPRKPQTNPVQPKMVSSANSYETLIKEMKGNLSKGSTPGQLHTFLGSVTESPQEVMTALFEALFDGAGKGFAKEVGKKMNYISAAVQDEGSQMLLLQAIQACGADAVKEVALVLKVLYDGDVLEEEIIVQWYEEGLAGGKNSQALKNAKPSVECLQNAESESEEE
ncbi:putative eukaryotic translation initiation factor 5-2 [Cocos nucifera]|nr:putative eukaryotic translation initiation factor 5-2 [Cocos nucifera]